LHDLHSNNVGPLTSVNRVTEMAGTSSATVLNEIKTEISSLRTELKRFIENANTQNVQTIVSDLKDNYAGLFVNHHVDTANTELSKNMVPDCKMKEQCFGVFMEFLQATAKHIKNDRVSEDLVSSYREQLKGMRKKGPFERCGTCFEEVNRLFEKQVELMKSLGIYNRTNKETPVNSVLSEEDLVRNILEPVANIQRFQILKSLAGQTRTFSDLTQLTGLRGGNLLFHIKKLTETGMILQRHERGDYVITEKGWKTLNHVIDLNTAVNS
jgi:DNA-binding transcriptional ArsR family regulator/predicted site-specific integrase-resolvase